MEKDAPPWERFGDWLHSICVVTFDLELGQALEVIYPGDALLSVQEKTNICYLAFPDSNSGNNKDTNFHFRIRRCTADLTSSQRLLVERCSQSIDIDPRYLYGFVHFRQQKDASISRGYYQKSLVLISILPFFNLFSAVIERIAMQFFDNGEPAIEAACHDIDHWPTPIVSDLLSLPLLGSVIQCRIPSYSDLPFDSQQAILEKKILDGVHSETLILSTVHEVDPYKSLQTVLNHVQILWELMIIGEPLLVMSSSPQRCSAIVQSLISLIAPLKYLNDYRPFFTIHDSEFKEYSSKSRNPVRVLLGVTNPFFIKALEHWPHVLKVGDITEGNTLNDKQEKVRKNWDGHVMDTKPGFYTNFKPYLSHDKSLAKKLMRVDRPCEVQSNVMRRHFLELTQSFMMPLERYLSSLLPLKKEMSPFKSIPNRRSFSIDGLLSFLEGAGPTLTCGVKGDWAGLYGRFVKSSNFAGWLLRRTQDVNNLLKAHYTDALCSADLGSSVLSTKHHVEIVDLVMRIRGRINELETASERRQQLIRQILCILGGVDDELKQILMSNCSLQNIIA